MHAAERPNIGPFRKHPVMVVGQLEFLRVIAQRRAMAQSRSPS
jgi:hypothetical protein